MTMLQPLGRGQRVVYYFVDQWEVGSFDDRSVQFRLSYNAVRIVSLQHYIRLGSVRVGSVPVTAFSSNNSAHQEFCDEIFPPLQCKARNINQDRRHSSTGKTARISHGPIDRHLPTTGRKRAKGKRTESNSGEFVPSCRVRFLSVSDSERS